MSQWVQPLDAVRMVPGTFRNRVSGGVYVALWAMRHSVTVVGFMVMLAALDFGGTMLAKEWTTHRAAWQLVGGAAAFVALFAVLVSGLRYAEMSILTLGWIVVLQVAVVMVDRSRYGTTFTRSGWLAMLAILVLQGYLVLGAGTRSNAGDDLGNADQSTAASAES